MDAAQAAYDRAEPPEPDTCRFCDDQREVAVTEVHDAGGAAHGFLRGAEPAVPCPICVRGWTLGDEVLE